jgi:integrase
MLEKETVDELIFRTTNTRNRLLLELMARGGIRVGEVLKLRPRDVQGRKLVIRDPKSGKEQEIIYIPQKVADRLREIFVLIKPIYMKGYFHLVTRLPGLLLKRQAIW